LVRLGLATGDVGGEGDFSQGAQTLPKGYPWGRIKLHDAAPGGFMGGEDVGQEPGSRGAGGGFMALEADHFGTWFEAATRFNEGEPTIVLLFFQ